jgi:hypothetical protein
MKDRDEILSSYNYYILTRFLGNSSLEVCATELQSGHYDEECKYFKDSLQEKALEDNITITDDIFKVLMGNYLYILRNLSDECKSLHEIAENSKSKCTSEIYRELKRVTER